MAKIIYKKSRKQSVKVLDKILTDLDFWTGDFIKSKDILGNCITDLEDGYKRNLIFNIIKRNHKDLVFLRDELTEIINNLDSNIYEIDLSYSKK